MLKELVVVQVNDAERLARLVPQRLQIKHID